MAKYHYLALLCLSLTLGLLHPAGAGATEVLDQSQTVSSSSQPVYYNYYLAQTFTAGQYGRLDRVSLRLENYVPSPPTGAVLIVSVQTVVGGQPSGAQIGTGTIPFSAIPPHGDPGWVDISIAGAVVHAGTQYALVLHTNLTNAVATWWRAYNTSYTAGELFRDLGQGWIGDPQYDFTFQTYVVLDMLDQSQTSYNYPGSINTDCGDVLAQTFTAGLSGVLDRVNVSVDTTLGFFYGIGSVVATIQTVTGHDKHPSGNVIGQGSIAIYTQRAWVTIGLNSAVVTAGQQYALVLRYSLGTLCWNRFDNSDIYRGGEMWAEFTNEKGTSWRSRGGDAAFQTYVATPLPSAPLAPTAMITPCSSGVCPAVSAIIIPTDSTARVTSNVQFQEQPDGTVEGILNFNDSKLGNLVLPGCSTDSTSCLLTVTTFACTDEHAITVAGTYTPEGETASDYLLTLSGTSNGVGTFTLTTGDYTYTLMLDGIADVTCPPG